MDPFTEKMLLKAEQRNKVLKTKCIEPPPPSNPLPLREYNNFQSENRRELNFHKPVVTKTVKKTFNDNENDDFNVEINITTRPNIEVEVQVVEQTVDEDGSTASVSVPQSAGIRNDSRNRLHRLGALYSNTQDLSSPISRTEHKFCAQTEPFEEGTSRREKEKNGKFVALAASIREWEDDGFNGKEAKPVSTKNDKILYEKPTKAVDNKQGTPTSSRVQSTITSNDVQKNCVSKTIDMKWDKKVINSLEAQGFQRKDSMNTKVMYNFKGNSSSSSSDKEKPIETQKGNKTKPLVVKFDTKTDDEKKPKTPTKFPAIKSNLVMSKIRAFETETDSGAKKPKKDPTELSLKERMQLFEKNKGPAVVPKTFYGTSAPGPITARKPSKETVSANSSAIPAPIEKNFRGKIFAGESSSTTMSEASIKLEIEKQKQADMEVIANRYRRGNAEAKETPAVVPAPPPPPPPPAPQNLNTSANFKKRPSGDSSPNNKGEDSDDSKRVKISEPLRLYPSLPKFDNEVKSSSFSVEDVTTTPSSSFSSYRNHGDEASDESYMEEEEPERYNHNERKIRFQSNLQATAPPEYSSSERKFYRGDSSITSENSGGLTEDYLDEALEEGLDEDVESQTESSDPTAVTATTTASEDNKVITLVHTVSFYRRQQGTKPDETSPTKVIIRNQKITEVENESDESNEDRRVHFESKNEADREEAHMVKMKVEKLLSEVCKQQQIIGQTSQALNLCASTIEFSGSTEAVEGERHLLVATHRRQVALDEIQRLRVEGQIRSTGTPKERGRLTVKEITIPLRSEYIRKLSNDAITGHHLVCLLKYNDTVLATKTVPTLPGLLAVKFPDVLQLDQAYADFRVTLEIYGMTAQRESLPHEVKYHIDISKKTPKKRGKDSRMISPMPQSPAVNIVRTPAFVQYGFAIFSLREIQRNSWTLNRVSGVSPLEGTVSMKLDCELQVTIDYKGFLTMFEEVSGFGSWHRRWCRLNGHILSYWKYPDDEKRKAPIGSIDLSTCCSQKIQIAPRDICARLNTILVECSRPPQPNDFESLVIVPLENKTIVRSLLSADTKDERDEWCAYLNKSLTLLRAWNPRN